jgi:3-oxoacyl-[acyl-carrier protein] reductase
MIKSPLEGKVAIVTGAEQGPGAGVAAELARLGAILVVQYDTSFAAAKRLVREVEREGGQAIAIKADLRDAAQADVLCQKAYGVLGTVDLMVVTTALEADAPVPATAAEAAEAVRGRLLAFLSPIYAAVAGMSERAGGSIVHVTHGAGPGPSQATAGTALRHLAAQAGAAGVRINTVVAGPAGPAGAAEAGAAGAAATGAGGGDREDADGGGESPSSACRDVAGAIALLAGDAFEQVTGVTLTLGAGSRIA